MAKKKNSDKPEINKDDLLGNALISHAFRGVKSGGGKDYSTKTKSLEKDELFKKWIADQQPKEDDKIETATAAAPKIEEGKDYQKLFVTNEIKDHIIEINKNIFNIKDGIQRDFNNHKDEIQRDLNSHKIDINRDFGSHKDSTLRWIIGLFIGIFLTATTAGVTFYFHFDSRFKDVYLKIGSEVKAIKDEIMKEIQALKKPPAVTPPEPKKK